MTDSAPTEVIGFRKQSLASNNNQWGDTYLNVNFDTAARLAKGWQEVTFTGSRTVSETNYSATNETAVPMIEAVGSLSAAANYVIPSRANFFVFWNNGTGQTITVKYASSTGVAVPNNRTVILAADGSEVYNVTPNLIAAITESNDRDLVDKAYVDSVVAASTIPAATGAVKISAADSSAQYLSGAITFEGPISSSIQNASADETLQVKVTYGAMLNGGTISTQSSAVANTEYLVDCTSSAVPVYMPINAAPRDKIKLAKGGTQSMILNVSQGTLIDGSSAAVALTDEGMYEITYHSSARGYV